MTQAERVKKIRKTLGLTLEKFGANLGVGKTAIFNLEKGDVGLTDRMIKLICTEYNVNYDYIVYGEGDMFESIPESFLDELCNKYKCDEFDKKIIIEYLKLPVEEREYIKKYMRNVFGK